MPILETRSEVKVTVTQVWYTTLRHPKMHAHQIWDSYLKRTETLITSMFIRENTMNHEF